MPAPTSPPDAVRCRLVCLGNLTVDDVVQPDGIEHAGTVGGDALYGVLAARLFEGTAQPVAPVGTDLPGAVRTAVEATGCSTLGLVRRTAPTLRNRIDYLSADERVVTMLSTDADFDALSPRGADIPEAFWQADAFVILAMALDAQRDLIAASRVRRDSSLLLALDPQEEYIAGHEGAILDMLAGLDLFMPSLGEVHALLGHTDAARAARQFATHGPRIVVIKMGAQGCLVHDARQDRDIRLPAHPARVLDTTGAGDAFCAGFVATLIDHPADLDLAARAGAVAAAIAVGGIGPAGLLAATPHEACAMLDAWDGAAE